MFMQRQQKKNTCQWISLSSQLASSKSQNRTLIHKAVSVHACHLRPQTCLPSTEKSKEKEQVGKTSPTLALDCKHANHVCQIHLNFQLGWEHHIFTKHYTNKESQQIEGTSGWSINSVLTNLCKLSKKQHLSLYTAWPCVTGTAGGVGGIGEGFATTSWLKRQLSP